MSYLVNHHSRSAIDLKSLEMWLPECGVSPMVMTLNQARGVIVDPFLPSVRLVTRERLERVSKWLDEQKHLVNETGICYESTMAPWGKGPIYPEWLIYNVRDDDVVHCLGAEAWISHRSGFYKCQVSNHVHLRLENTYEHGWTLRVNHSLIGSTPMRFIELESPSVRAKALLWYLEHQEEFPSWFRVLPRDLMFKEPNSTLECPCCDDLMNADLNSNSEATLIPAHCPFCMMAGGLLERQPDGRLLWYRGHPNVNME